MGFWNRVDKIYDCVANYIGEKVEKFTRDIKDKRFGEIFERDRESLERETERAYLKCLKNPELCQLCGIKT